MSSWPPVELDHNAQNLLIQVLRFLHTVHTYQGHKIRDKMMIKMCQLHHTMMHTISKEEDINLRIYEIHY